MATLVSFHAHPDDECIACGGVIRKAADAGHRVVLVVATRGEEGEIPEGLLADGEKLWQRRVAETEASAGILGAQRVEFLGYHDSGMMGWPSNDAPGSFWSMPVEEAAAPLVELVRRYQPDVVVTYDDFGFYGHPDHIQAHRITLAALEETGSTAKLYFPTFRRSRLPEFRERLAQAGIEPPDIDESSFGAPDDAIGATVDCREHASAKRAALAAHVSQQENIFFLRIPMADFTEAFGVEEFIRVRPAPDGGEPEADLFAGLRE
jgi:LmbE family N-acetylglucosaminyl deacetylase